MWVIQMVQRDFMSLICKLLMRYRTWFWAIPAILWFGLSGMIWPPSPHYDLSKYKRFSDSTEQKILAFFQKYYRAGSFNGTFLFYKNDSLYQGALGYANFPRKDTLINDDLFQLASVSKTVTGISIMLLIQDGYIKIDDSVHWYIPELDRKNLTIKNLVSHKSGLPDYFGFSSNLWPWAERHMSNEDVVIQLNQQSPRAFGTPGTYYDYSNTNFALLALIVERLSGMDFRQFALQNIFKPAGMKYTHINQFDSIPLNAYPVQGYSKWKIYSDIPHNGTTGDKGVYSNTTELFLLDRYLRTSYMLHKGVKDLMWSEQTNTGENSYYGMGWRIKWIDGHKWVFHNGWWKGFRTYYWRCLDEDKCFVALSNNVQGPFLRTVEMVELLK